MSTQLNCNWDSQNSLPSKAPDYGWPPKNLEWDLGGGRQAASITRGRWCRAQAPWWPAPVATGSPAHFVRGDPTRSPPSASLSPGLGMHDVPWRDGHLLLQGIHMVEVRGDE